MNELCAEKDQRVIGLNLYLHIVLSCCRIDWEAKL